MNTEILVITDRSGSMDSIADDVIGGFNSFISDQRTVPGEAKVTFAQFDDQYEIVYAGKPIQDVPALTRDTYKPRGGTALLDAIGRTLNEQGKRIAKEAWAELVVVCVLTDGHENVSREYSRERIKEMTTHAEKNGWKFVYVAANQDAFSAAHSLGMQGAITQNFAANAAGAAMAYASTSASLRGLRTS
jgi:uncharacterized protein with von Willebrand factor type A (vWA) domain